MPAPGPTESDGKLALMVKPNWQRQRVVILGGGFAGLAAAQGLEADRFDVTLIDRRGSFEFLPNIHELLSGVKTPELLRLPLDGALAGLGHRFVNDTVTGIDPVERAVSVEQHRPIGYDALVVALGGVDATHGVVGVTDHAHPFKSVEDCARIGSRLAELDAGGQPASVVIIGGGLEGVEALGEILRRYRRNRLLQVTLVEARKRLLPEAPATLDRRIRKLCRPFNVAFEMDAPVEGIESDRVLLRDGRGIAADLVIWTGGPAPPPELSVSGLAPKGAWAGVNDSLQSNDYEEVFVVGDAAEVPEAISKQAYHALDMGECVATNVARFVDGRELVSFRPSPKPTLISFGDLTCFMVLGERAASGAALSAAKEALFEVVMTQLDSAPWWRRIPGATARSGRAVHELLWPTLTSPRAVLRQANLRLL
jgi:NADH dehydrogenase FAD-containing subunit